MVAQTAGQRRVHTGIESDNVDDEPANQIRYRITVFRGVPIVIATSTEVCVFHLFPDRPQDAIDWFERKAKIKVEPGSRRSILQSTKAAQQ